jgi:hypothetical protein
MAATTPNSGDAANPNSAGSRPGLLLWQVLATAGFLAMSAFIMYFHYRCSGIGAISQWRLFVWLLVGFLVALSLWAGPGTGKLIAGFIRHRAAIKLAADAKSSKHHRITWFEWQMIDASWAGIIILALLSNGLGLAVGVYALKVCRDQRARKKAAVLAALGGGITAVAIVLAISKLRG